jgi:hypothetical protein
MVAEGIPTFELSSQTTSENGPQEVPVEVYMAIARSCADGAIPGETSIWCGCVLVDVNVNQTSGVTPSIKLPQPGSGTDPVGEGAAQLLW